MLNEGFEALLTFDKNIQHQQNFSKYPIAVFLLTGSKNTYEEMKKREAHTSSLLRICQRISVHRKELMTLNTSFDAKRWA
jgi:hypothetical protein